MKKLKLANLLTAASASTILASFIAADAFAAAPPNLLAQIRAHGGRPPVRAARVVAPVSTIVQAPVVVSLQSLQAEIQRLNGEIDQGRREYAVLGRTVSGLEREIRELEDDGDDYGDLPDKRTELTDAQARLNAVGQQITANQTARDTVTARISTMPAQTSATAPVVTSGGLSASAAVAATRAAARAALAAEAERRRLAAQAAAPTVAATNPAVPTVASVVGGTTVTRPAVTRPAVTNSAAPNTANLLVNSMTARRTAMNADDDGADDDGDDNDNSGPVNSGAQNSTATATATATTTAATAVNIASTRVSTATTSTTATTSVNNNRSGGNVVTPPTATQLRIIEAQRRSREAAERAQREQDERARTALSERRRREQSEIAATRSVNGITTDALRQNLEGLLGARNNSTTSNLTNRSQAQSAQSRVVVNPFLAMSQEQRLSAIRDSFAQLLNLRQRQGEVENLLAERNAAQAALLAIQESANSDDIPLPPDEDVPPPPDEDAPTPVTTTASTDWREIARLNRENNIASGRAAAISNTRSSNSSTASSATPPASANIQNSPLFQRLQAARLQAEEAERVAQEARHASSVQTAGTAATATTTATTATTATTTATAATQLASNQPDVAVIVNNTNAHNQVSMEELLDLYRASPSDNEIVSRFLALTSAEQSELCRATADVVETTGLGLSILEMDLSGNEFEVIQESDNQEGNASNGYDSRSRFPSSSENNSSQISDSYYAAYDRLYNLEMLQFLDDVFDFDLKDQKKEELISVSLIDQVVKNTVINPNNSSETAKFLASQGIKLDEVEGAFDDNASESFSNETKALAYLASLRAITEEEVSKEQQKSALHGVQVAANESVVVTNLIVDRIITVGSVSGLAAGDDDVSVTKGLWISGVYGVGKQNSKTAYNSQTTGFAIGADVGIGENEANLVGAAYSNISSNFKMKKLRSGDKAEVKSSVYSLYSQFEVLKNVLLQSSVSVVDSKVTNKNLKLVGVNNRQVAKAKFDSLGYSFNGSLSYVYKLDSLVLMPNIAVKYGKTVDEAYNETGTGVHNLSISSKSTRAISTVAGLTAFLPKTILEDVYVAPMIHGSIEKILSNKEKAAKIKLKWANQVFTDNIKTNSDDKMGYNAGVGLLVKYKNINVQTSYNYHAKKHYSSHQGALKLEVKF